jgi:hypothetical protein
MKRFFKIFLTITFPIWVIPMVSCIVAYAIWDLVNLMIDGHCTNPECKACKEEI